MYGQPGYAVLLKSSILDLIVYVDEDDRPDLFLSVHVDSTNYTQQTILITIEKDDMNLGGAWGRDTRESWKEMDMMIIYKSMKHAMNNDST